MSQKCRDCNGMSWNQIQPERPYVISCPTCEGKGGILRTGPYRLADGTWSDGVDRDEPLSVWTRPNGRWQVYQCKSDYWEAYAEVDGQQLDEINSFLTHAEAVAYADKQARTATNGETK